jgi:hypothetical protein
MAGRSILEDSHEFFTPVIQEIQEYVKKPADSTLIKIKLDYINSGSKKYLAKILCIYNELYLSGKKVSILWNYDLDDDSIIDLGNDIMGMIQIPFRMEGL